MPYQAVEGRVGRGVRYQLAIFEDGHATVKQECLNQDAAGGENDSRWATGSLWKCADLNKRRTWSRRDSCMNGCTSTKRWWT